MFAVTTAGPVYALRGTQSAEEPERSNTRPGILAQLRRALGTAAAGLEGWRDRVPIQERVVAIELGAAQIRTALMSRNGETLVSLPNVRLSDELEHGPISSLGNHLSFLKLINRRIWELLKQAGGLGPSEIAAISIVSPGDLDEAEGVYRHVETLPIPDGFPMAQEVRDIFRGRTLRVYLSKAQSDQGLAEAAARFARETALWLEDWVRPIDPERWASAIDPAVLLQSFSGIRAVVAPDLANLAYPLESPLSPRPLSPEHRLIFAYYGYLYALHQIQKFQEAGYTGTKFAMVLARDPRPTGEDVLESQIRGMRVAARERGVRIQVRDGGVLPTPLAEASVRLKRQGIPVHGGVIVTASHKEPSSNGVKYVTAEKEPNALVQGGVLLPVGQMQGIVDGFKAWAQLVRQDIRHADPFISELNRPYANSRDPLLKRKMSSSAVAGLAYEEAKRMWSIALLDVSGFMQKARKVRIVLDPNGGAAVGFYKRFLERFGFQVVEINGALGQPGHKLEPVDEALEDAERALVEHDADFAVVADYDADRGNTVIRDRASGEIIRPNPQEVAAMNVAMALARAQIVRDRTQDKRKMAVVVHDATSRRVWEVAKTFGAKVVAVEVGEANVLEVMRHLERAGDRVVIGVEGANGGTVFRGEDPEFQGDTSRNGVMTALFTGIVATHLEIARRWFEVRRAALGESAQIPESPTLAQILKSLPGEAGDGNWRFVTTPADLRGRPGDVPPEKILDFKQAAEELWYQQIWPQIREGGSGLPLSDGTQQPFSTFRVIHHQGAEESPAYGPNDSPGAELTSYGKGGTTIELTLPDGTEAFLWYRGSLTEGQLRASAEGQGARAAEIAKALLALFERKIYPKALAKLQAAAGLEQGGVEQLLDRPEGPVAPSVTWPAVRAAIAGFSRGEGPLWELPWAGVAKKRTVLVDGSEDDAVRFVAQAMSVLMQEDLSPELEFRAVLPQRVAELAYRELETVNPQAVEFLKPRVKVYGGESGLTYPDALRAARADLAGFAGTPAGEGTEAPFVVKILSTQLALRLIGYFEAGQLNFASDEARRRLLELFEWA